MAFNYRLDSITAKINKFYLDSLNTDLRYPSKSVIETFIRTEILNDFKKITFYDFYESFISSAASGSRVNGKGRNVKPEAAKYYKRSLKLLREFKPHLEFEDITLDFYKDFIAYLNARGLAMNTVGDNIKKLKAITAASMEQG